jgi:hypothetical protein
MSLEESENPNFPRLIPYPEYIQENSEKKSLVFSMPNHSNHSGLFEVLHHHPLFLDIQAPGYLELHATRCTVMIPTLSLR